ENPAPVVRALPLHPDLPVTPLFLSFFPPPFPLLSSFSSFPLFFFPPFFPPLSFLSLPSSFLSLSSSPPFSLFSPPSPFP
ncbi:hypothetical protein ACXWR7_12735, partial [Streptococcus pyogenes]